MQLTRSVDSVWYCGQRASEEMEDATTAIIPVARTTAITILDVRILVRGALGLMLLGDGCGCGVTPKSDGSVGGNMLLAGATLIMFVLLLLLRPDEKILPI